MGASSAWAMMCRDYIADAESQTDNISSSCVDYCITIPTEGTQDLGDLQQVLQQRI